MDLCAVLQCLDEMSLMLCGMTMKLFVKLSYLKMEKQKG